MGAWGYGPFENDQALDWVGELSKSGDPGLPAAVLRDLDATEYLGTSDGCVGLAAAEVVAASRGWPLDPIPEGVREWLTAAAPTIDDSTAELAVSVIDKIEGVRSELAELWDDPDDGHRWHETVADLRQRLQAPMRKVSARPPAMKPRVQLGDVVELPTSAGQVGYIQLTGEMDRGGDVVRVLPGLFAAPLDEQGLAAAVSGETAYLSGAFFKKMITRAGGRPRGNYPVPPACAAPQPMRIGSNSRGRWKVDFGGRSLTAEEFARLHPDIDQTMLAWWGDFPGTDTLLRMIECGWRPSMDGTNGWMYPKDPGAEPVPPARMLPFPDTAIPGKFLIDA